jgi:hypothetical protein
MWWLNATVHYKKEPGKERTFQLFFGNLSSKYKILLHCIKVGGMQCLEAKQVKGTANFMTIKLTEAYLFIYLFINLNAPNVDTKEHDRT